MRYQLVLQFAAKSADDFDRLVGFEGRLVQELANLAEVDGHDFGRSEFNIFVLTDAPEKTFEKARRFIADQGLQYDLRAAYRELTGERYVILWPSTLRQFTVS